MAELYRARLAGAAPEGAEAMRRDQQAWLRQRGQCEQQPAASPAIVACVGAMITARIVALRPVAAAPAPSAAPPPPAAGWTVVAADGGCTLTRPAVRDRRFAIERPAGAAPDQPGIATFRPAEAEGDLVAPGDTVVFIADQQRVPATVPRDGPPRAVVPPERAAAAIKALAAAGTLTVVRQIDTLLEIPLAGFAEAYRDMGTRCGFDPAPFL